MQKFKVKTGIRNLSYAAGKTRIEEQLGRCIAQHASSVAAGYANKELTSGRQKLCVDLQGYYRLVGDSQQHADAFTNEIPPMQ